MAPQDGLISAHASKPDIPAMSEDELQVAFERWEFGHHVKNLREGSGVLRGKVGKVAILIFDFAKTN